MFPAAVVASLCVLTAATGGESVDAWPRADHQRIVRNFDFYEPDNLGDIPKYWELFPGESFPRYADGRFDRSVGRTAPPSFYLGMNGRNVAFRYRGIETRIRPNSDYLVVGWIRPDRLRSARATITAYYLDHEGAPLPETQRQGRFVGGEEMGDGWHRVEVLLPSGPFDADALGLTLWVEQAAIWDSTPRPDRHIERTDVHAGAWFDDILVYRLPRVALKAASLANLFVAPAAPTLNTTVLDHDGEGLDAALAVFDASGGLVERRPVPVQVSDHAVRLPGLEPGYYHAHLTVTSGDHRLVDRRLSFAVLAALPGVTRYASRAFGVVLDGEQRDGADADGALISAAGLGAVKVPMWTGSAVRPGFVEDSATLDRLLNGLLRLRAEVTGVLGGLPPALAYGPDAYRRSLLDILNDPVESWRGFLAQAVAPYASVLASWQLGSDGDASVAEDPRLGATLDAVRREMRSLMTVPYLSAPATVQVDPSGEALPADGITLAIPRGVHPAYIGSHIQPFRNLDYARLDAYVGPAPGTYDRMARLGHWATRIIRARHAGADTVFVPQPWHWRRSVDGLVVEPTEDFVVFRTISMMLGDARADGSLFAAGGVRALVFALGNRSVLAAWDPEAPAEGRVWEVQLGAATRAVDLWGRSAALERTETGLHRLVLTQTPIFVDDIERWVLTLQRELKIVPSTVEFSLAAREHAIRIVNPTPRTLVGRLTLAAAPSWRIQPRKMDFNVGPGGEASRPVEIRYGHNEPAGPKILLADMQLGGGQGYRLRVPMRFELGIADVDVWGFATVEGDRVVARHSVRNRSGEALSFRVYAAAPGRDRLHKVIIGLEPGASIVREYWFDRATELIGRKIHIRLREVNGPRMHNLQLTAQ